MSLVSVIVPIYNAARYLESCIGSIINSTYRNLQIILVDDGSTDLSNSICDRFAENDDRVVVIHQHNSGIAAARNTGVCAATGKYISFVDADDQISPEFYTRMVATMESECADIVACEYRNKIEDVLQNRRAPLCNKTVFQTFEEQLSVLTCAPSIRSITWTGPYIWNKLYMADKIMELFKEECRMCEDLRFNYDYIKSSNKMVVLADGLYFYRLHDASITGAYRTAVGHTDISEQGNTVTADRHITIRHFPFNYGLHRALGTNRCGSKSHKCQYKNKSKNKFFHICSAYKFFSFSNSDSSMILKNPYCKACF